MGVEKTKVTTIQLLLTDWNEAGDTARVAARVAARYAARDAAVALVVRDLISQEHFDTLTAPMRAAGVNFDELGGNGE